MTIFTIGHSTRPLEALVALLEEFEIAILADIRSFPASRRHPQFNRENLERALPAAGVEYVWLGKALGGYRKTKDPNSPNIALRSPGFRNYADHMYTADFGAGIALLLELARSNRLAVMCAEHLWWRCHRSLVSDHLSACWGVEILHILERGKTQPHRLHRAARLFEGRLIYDVADQGSLL